jgi:hypothetical protein
MGDIFFIAILFASVKPKAIAWVVKSKFAKFLLDFKVKLRLNRGDSET